MTVGSNIKRIREQRGLTQEEFGKIADVSSMAVSQWENDRAVPRMGAVQRIADYFKIPKSEIIDDSRSVIPAVPGARRAVAAPTVKAPILGRVHAGPAGDPDVFDEDYGEAEILASYFDKDPEIHVLDYEGDCMNKVFGEGTTSLIVSPNSPFGNGDIVVAVINDTEYVVRKIEQTAKELRLKPCSWNPEHEDIVIPRDSDQRVDFKGKVLECFRRFD